ncbi:ribosome small subunit-dependent GTPase A [Longirhabdus pacifica]|uniref:ribosome small subunit-dependent GTPase A n=1 Tax=Longirhabdus pacifica TaxID=2305227 RepID=UPI0010089A64|nr:ribosome small subunit-dependent GTPase A [Longirhabdus pacifica]
MPSGLIIKALSGYYYVLPDHDQDKIITCRARGVFKKKEITPLVGDKVEYEQREGDEGTIVHVGERHAELIRPPIANVDTALLVFSLAEPTMNKRLLDKFLVHVENAGLDACICLTKSDLIHEDDTVIEEVTAVYSKIGYPIFVTSKEDVTTVDSLLQSLQHKIVVLAGQSGVGKSSLINIIHPELKLNTAEISNKLGRGKHTTRHVELIALPHGGMIADTPGFSSLDFNQLEVEDLGDCFKEFRSYTRQCKFRGCLHVQEPGCKVIEAKDDGEIDATRYEHYIQFITEMNENKRRY